jgi:Type II secretion system protein C
MMRNKKMIWIVVATLAALVAAGGLMAWAAPPDGKDGAEQADPERAGSYSGGVSGSVSVPGSGPRTRAPQIAMDAELVGTAVIEGGTSYAMFQSASGTRLVREGDEIASGVRLVQVRMNRIDIERNGVHEEIRLGYSQGARQQFRPGSNPAGSGVEKRALQREYLKAKGVLQQG